MARVAFANWAVVNDLTKGIKTTNSGTRIATLFAHTSPVAWTVRVDGAFGSANLRGIAIVTRQALANAQVVVRLTECVYATGTGIARQDHHGRWTRLWSRAEGVGIAHIALGTIAHRTVGHHTTES